MKVFHVYNDIMHHHHREYRSAEEASKHFHPSFIFVDAPDYVFEGWGYDSTATGDDRFIKPTAPDGWVYDDATGAFYPTEETIQKMIAASETTE